VAQISGAVGSTSNCVFVAADSGGNKCVIYGNGNIQNADSSYGALSDTHDLGSTCALIEDVPPRSYSGAWAWASSWPS
jgi:hypothetical protein